MKKRHVFILILLAGLLMSSLLLLGDLSTYVSIDEAKQSEGKMVSVICRLDMSQPLTYDPLNNPNFVSFAVVDSLGGKMQVVYRNAKPTDMERSERIVLKGAWKEPSVFECSEILMKCPSKYNDNALPVSHTASSPTS